MASASCSPATQTRFPMTMRKRDDADHNAGSAGLRGLLVRDPYASQLLDGQKIWEIRGRSTHIRGPILIIKSGTGQLFGTADLVRVLGPLELEDLVDASELPPQEREEFRRSGLPYAKTCAYVFSNPRRFQRPRPYRHPSGAVTWVRLPEIDLGSVRYASSPYGGSQSGENFSPALDIDSYARQVYEANRVAGY